MITFDSVEGTLRIIFSSSNFRYSVRSNKGIHIDGFVKTTTPYHEISLNVTDGEILVALMYFDEKPEICKFFTVHSPDSWVEDLVIASNSLEN